MVRKALLSVTLTLVTCQTPGFAHEIVKSGTPSTMTVERVAPEPGALNIYHWKCSGSCDGQPVKTGVCPSRAFPRNTACVLNCDRTVPLGCQR